MLAAVAAISRPTQPEILILSGEFFASLTPSAVRHQRAYHCVSNRPDSDVSATTMRGWRGALSDAGLALLLLLGLTAALGPALTRIPIDIVQLAVGSLLLLFGLRWLRKAILRAAGIIPFAR